MIKAYFIVVFYNFGAAADSSPWSTWWSYNGVAGPEHWGYLNPDWLLCRSGKFQSPIDIQPRVLLFDPNLQHIKHELPMKTNGIFKNTGNDLTFVFKDLPMAGANFSKGPLLYNYRAAELKIHFGRRNDKGSEHKIDGENFVAEIHILCFNSDLFKTFHDAKKRPYGVAILAIMAQVARGSDLTNTEFRKLAATTKRIPWIGQEVPIDNLDLRSLIPKTRYYVTYEGSFTQPGCYETVTWVIFNKPIFISTDQLDAMRQLQKRQKDTRMVMTEGNIRPIQPQNNRALRTNINYPNTGGLCNMKRVTYYKATEGLQPNKDALRHEKGPLKKSDV